MCRLILIVVAGLVLARTELLAGGAAGEREWTIEKRYLLLPVKVGEGKKSVKSHATLTVAGAVVREFDIDLASPAEFFVHLDVSAWRGQKVIFHADKLPEGSQALDLITQSDAIWQADQLYKEPLRPQLHFSAQRGWNNDVNGLVFADGEYHMYFQHNPYGWYWGNMHWGHAVSPDLVHWRELPIALYPRRYGDFAFSGGAVVDKDNTSGWKKGTNALIVAAYTSTGRGECIIYSNDRGRTFQEFEGNPVIRHSGRDPRPFWYAPGKHWVIAVFDEGGFAFYTSTDLKKWTQQSRLEGFHECPDLFELPLGDQKLWVVTAATDNYMVGKFDGKKFTPVTSKLKGDNGRIFYAAQTFSEEPKGRVVQIGWLKVPAPGMPFNQAMSLPQELTLRQTPEGPRLRRLPVVELQSLREGSNQAASLSSFRSELIELRAEFEPGDAQTVEFTVRGAKIIYDVKAQQLIAPGGRRGSGTPVPAPLVDGKQSLVVYLDCTVLEIFASDGLTYVPTVFKPEAGDLSVAVEAKGGKTKTMALQVYKLKSCWNRE